VRGRARRGLFGWISRRATIFCERTCTRATRACFGASKAGSGQARGVCMQGSIMLCVESREAAACMQRHLQEKG